MKKHMNSKMKPTKCTKCGTIKKWNKMSYSKYCPKCGQTEKQKVIEDDFSSI